MIWNHRAFISFSCVICVLFDSVCCAQDISFNDINTVEISSQHPLPSTTQKVTKSEPKKYVCPRKTIRVPFFALPCKSSRECSFLAPGLLCCSGRCVGGVEPPKPEPRHSPIFGIIDRVCPVDPMPELLAVQECTVDAECGPRICCPERPTPGRTSKSYCRNGAPRLTKMPAIRQFLLPLKAFASYLQCTPPPPPFLDLFPKFCESPLDCFPSLCCQEHGKKICRPPKKSLFALIATAAQKIGTSALAKSFIQRIS